MQEKHDVHDPLYYSKIPLFSRLSTYVLSVTYSTAEEHDGRQKKNNNNNADYIDYLNEVREHNYLVLFHLY